MIRIKREAKPKNFPGRAQFRAELHGTFDLYQPRREPAMKNCRMTTALHDGTAEKQSADILIEIRERLQAAHFAARGIRFPGTGSAGLADELHTIRLLTEELAARLAA